METAMITPNLENVQKTLLLPLWGRAQAGRMKDPVLIDRRAEELIGRMNYDFSPLFQKLGLFHALTLATRARQFDAILRDFIRRRGAASVVSIGAGLDTAFSRMDGELVRWYDVDLPEVIELRKRMIPETARMVEIPKSILDEDAFAKVGETDNVLFLAGGVFMYLEEAQVRQILGRLAARFPGAEIVFDVLSPAGIRYYNRKLAKSGFHGAVMKWGVRDVCRLKSWEKDLTAVRSIPFYSGLRVRPSWPIDVRIKLRAANLLDFGHIFHLAVKSEKA